MRLSRRLPRGAGLAILQLAGVFYFWHFLGRFQYLPGTDAYFYALQAQSLLDTGHLKVPDHGVLYYGIAAAARLGMSIETSFRTVLTTVFASVILALSFHAARLREEALPIAVALIAIAAPAMAFHTIEFPKLSLGLAAIPVWFRLASDRRPWAKPLLWIALAVSALLHPLVSVLAMVVAGVLAAASVHARYQGRVIVSTRIRVAGLLGAAAIGILIGYFSPGLGSRLLSLEPGMPGLLTALSAPDTPLDIRGTILFLWVSLAALSVRYLRRGQSPHKYLPIPVLALALWPDNSDGLFGMGGRLAMAFVFIALPTILEVVNRLGIGRAALPEYRTYALRGAISAAVALTLFLPARLSSYGGLLMNDDYPQFARVVEDLQGRRIPMLIAYRGLDFYYTYRLRRDAFHFDPEPTWNRSEVWRVVSRVTPEELAFYSPSACSWGDTTTRIRGTRFLLVREDCWERFRARITRHGNPDLYMEIWQDMENPSQPRPAFLRAKYSDMAEQLAPVPGR